MVDTNRMASSLVLVEDSIVHGTCYFLEGSAHTWCGFNVHSLRMENAIYKQSGRVTCLACLADEPALHV